MKNLIEKIKQFFLDLKNRIFGDKEKEKKEVASVGTKEGSVSSDTFVKQNLSESDKEATKAAEEEIAKQKNKRKELIKKIIIVVAIIIIIIIVIRTIISISEKNAEKEEVMKNVQTARVMNISSEISGSGTLAPKDSYTITSLVEGNITNVLFEIGDKVVKNQLLLIIESSTAYRNTVNASSSVIQARDNYEQAKYEYEKLDTDYSGRTYKAEFNGSLREFKVKAGDTLKNGTEIGTIVNDKKMKVKVPFVATDMSYIKTGMEAYLELQETGEMIKGVVKSIAQESQVIGSGALVKYVTVSCDNPGGLTENNTALCYIGNCVSIEDAQFEMETNEKITFNDGNDVEIEKLLVSEGAYVSKGTPLFLITEKTINNVITSKKRAYLQAEESLTKAENNYKDTVDAYDEYFITAPIDGTVITKDARVGDKVQRNSNGTKTLSTIYDLSELKFDMDIDELDITKIKNGQIVNIQADAFNNKVFEGVITNVSLVAANNNGVTNYPVTVTVTNVGELLPGMNVDAYVVLSQAENVVCIPSGALQRGNVVYVENSSKTIKEKNYSTEGISDRVKSRVPEGFTAINVETGISNDNFIEIKSGIQEGDLVYVSESNNNSFGFGGMGGGMGGMRGGMGGGPRR